MSSHMKKLTLFIVAALVLLVAATYPTKAAGAPADQPLYLLTLKFKKSSFTLDPFQHMKDSAQAVELTLPVDREYFELQAVGGELKTQFRGWSMLTTGDISSYKITVERKETKPRK